MNRIRSQITVSFVQEDNRNLIRAEIECDTAADLPGIDDYPGKRLSMGSVAWDISTGDFYGLNSSGEWINQTTGKVHDKEEVSNVEPV